MDGSGNWGPFLGIGSGADGAGMASLAVLQPGSQKLGSLAPGSGTEFKDLNAPSPNPGDFYLGQRPLQGYARGQGAFGGQGLLPTTPGSFQGDGSSFQAMQGNAGPNDGSNMGRVPSDSRISPSMPELRFGQIGTGTESNDAAGVSGFQGLQTNTDNVGGSNFARPGDNRTISLNPEWATGYQNMSGMPSYGTDLASVSGAGQQMMNQFGQPSAFANLVQQQQPTLQQQQQQQMAGQGYGGYQQQLGAPANQGYGDPSAFMANNGYLNRGVGGGGFQGMGGTSGYGQSGYGQSGYGMNNMGAMSGVNLGLNNVGIGGSNPGLMNSQMNSMAGMSGMGNMGLTSNMGSMGAGMIGGYGSGAGSYGQNMFQGQQQYGGDYNQGYGVAQTGYGNQMYGPGNVQAQLEEWQRMGLLTSQGGAGQQFGGQMALGQSAYGMNINAMGQFGQGNFAGQLGQQQQPFYLGTVPPDANLLGAGASFGEPGVGLQPNPVSPAGTGQNAKSKKKAPVASEEEEDDFDLESSEEEETPRRRKRGKGDSDDDFGRRRKKPAAGSQPVRRTTRARAPPKPDIVEEPAEKPPKPEKTAKAPKANPEASTPTTAAVIVAPMTSNSGLAENSAEPPTVSQAFPLSQVQPANSQPPIQPPAPAPALAPAPAPAPAPQQQEQAPQPSLFPQSATFGMSMGISPTSSHISQTLGVGPNVTTTQMLVNGVPMSAQVPGVPPSSLAQQQLSGPAPSFPRHIPGYVPAVQMPSQRNQHQQQQQQQQSQLQQQQMSHNSTMMPSGAQQGYGGGASSGTHNSAAAGTPTTASGGDSFVGLARTSGPSQIPLEGNNNGKYTDEDLLGISTSKLKLQSLMAAAAVDPQSGDHFCPVCDKSFKKMVPLKSHLKMHDTTKSFQCPHCNRSFLRAHDRHRHIRSIHLDKKSFICPACGTQFARSDALRRHTSREGTPCYGVIATGRKGVRLERIMAEAVVDASSDVPAFTTENPGGATSESTGKNVRRASGRKRRNWDGDDDEENDEEEEEEEDEEDFEDEEEDFPSDADAEGQTHDGGEVGGAGPNEEAAEEDAGAERAGHTAEESVEGEGVPFEEAGDENQGKSEQAE